MTSKAIQYLDPEHFLDCDDLKKYYDKLRAYKLFYKNNPSTDKPLIRLCQKAEIAGVGYLFSVEELDEKELDKIDKQFKSLEGYGKKLELYGFHTYGGYYGFFRPDFTEVIHLLNTVVSLRDLDNIDRIYVTTEPHPSGDVRECYDYKKDKHKACTTCYVYYKAQRKRKLGDTDQNHDETEEIQIA